MLLALAISVTLLTPGRSTRLPKNGFLVFSGLPDDWSVSIASLLALNSSNEVTGA